MCDVCDRQESERQSERLTEFASLTSWPWSTKSCTDARAPAAASVARLMPTLLHPRCTSQSTTSPCPCRKDSCRAVDPAACGVVIIISAAIPLVISTRPGLMCLEAHERQLHLFIYCTRLSSDSALSADLTGPAPQGPTQCHQNRDCPSARH